MKIANLCPHALDLISEDGRTHTIPRGSNQARIEEARRAIGSLTTGEGVRYAVSAPSFGAPIGIPEPEEGTVYVVSAMVAAQTRRADVFSPGPLIRDVQGKVIGARGLTQAGK